MKKICIEILMVLTLASALSGCSSSPDQNQDSTMGIRSQDVSLLNSTLSFQCTDLNEYFYSLYFGIQMKNNSNQTISNDNIKSLKMVAGLLNVNGLGREETTEFVVAQSGIEPGGTGLLAFSLQPAPYFEWQSLDISINGKKIYDNAISISTSICP